MQEEESGLKFVCGRDINVSYVELESSSEPSAGLQTVLHKVCTETLMIAL